MLLDGRDSILREDCLRQTGHPSRMLAVGHETSIQTTNDYETESTAVRIKGIVADSHKGERNEARGPDRGAEGRDSVLRES